MTQTIAITLTKQCSRCREWKSTDDFYTHKRQGHQSLCRDCQIWNKYEKRYGLSESEARAMFARGCHACGATESRGHRSLKLQIDHDHETYAARGALCASCNKALGHLQDDPDRVAALLAYTLTWE